MSEGGVIWSIVEQTDIGWMSVRQKRGLDQVVHDLQKHGIVSTTFIEGQGEERVMRLGGC